MFYMERYRNINVCENFGWISDSIVLKAEEELLDYINKTIEYLDNLWKSGKISAEDFKSIVLNYEVQYDLYTKTFRDTFGYSIEVEEDKCSFVKYFNKAIDNDYYTYSYGYIKYN